MDVAAIGAAAAALLATKVGEGVAGGAGKSAWASMKGIYDLVRHKLAHDEQAQALLQSLEAQPQDEERMAAVAKLIGIQAQHDAGFREALEALVREAQSERSVGQVVTNVFGNAHIVSAANAPPRLPGSLLALHQLPPDVAHFTGREAELDRLHAHSGQGPPRTVVISAIAGTAGVGKTALAVHLAHELAPRFPDAQLYVNLHGYEPTQCLSPSQALDRLLRAFGVADEAMPATEDEQAALYRSLLADKRSLVLLDNASSAAQIRPLLPASPSSLALITSRDRLAGIVAAEGAQLLILDVLAPQEALELLGRIAGSDRVDAEPEAAAEVDRLCGYLPLAVRIAGARLAIRPSMRLAVLAKRLSDERHRLAELSAGDVGVRASFALSYRALDADTAQIFRHLGLIPGPDFAPEVAAALMDTTPEVAEELLETLVDVHLVELASTPRRYRFHDLLRLYAREQAQAEETDQDRKNALRRMLEWYLDTADAAERFVIPGRRRLPYKRTGRWQEPTLASLGLALAWFEVERAGLVAAIHEAANCGFHSIAWQLSDASRSFFHLRSYYADWKDTGQVGLTAARAAHDRQAEACMLTGLGHVCRELNRFEDAMDWYQLARAIYQEVGYGHVGGYSLHDLGEIYGRMGRAEKAIDCFQQARVIHQEAGDRNGESWTLHYLGRAYRDLHQLEEAIDCFQQARAIRHELGERWGEDMTLINLGEVYGDLQRFEEAVDCYQQALAISQQMGHRWGEARALQLLGFVLQHTEGIDAARVCWHEAFNIFTELGAPQAEEIRARLADTRGTREYPPTFSLCRPEP